MIIIILLLMKIKNKHIEIIVISIFILLFQISSIHSVKAKLKNRININSAVGSNTFQDYFTLQKFYPGQDPTKLFTENEFDAPLKYIVLNKDIIFLTNTLEEIAKIEGNISIEINL